MSDNKKNENKEKEKNEEEEEIIATRDVELNEDEYAGSALAQGQPVRGNFLGRIVIDDGKVYISMVRLELKNKVEGNNAREAYIVPSPSA